MGQVLAALFGSLIASLGKYFSVQKAFNLASIAVFTALMVALFLSFKSCSTGICSTAITNAATQYPTFAQGLGIAFNTTTYAAGSAYMLVWSACQLYIFKKKMLGVLDSGK